MLSAESFGISGPNAPTISEKIVTSTLNAIQQLLPSDKIEQVCREIGYTWRDRLRASRVCLYFKLYRDFTRAKAAV